MTDTTDRELLEDAAKACGIKITWHGDVDPWCFAEVLPGIKWNPLTDDGDAFRLAVKLGLLIDTQYNNGVGVGSASFEEVWESTSVEPYAATRRAIVRAAAEIGRSMT